MAARTKKTTTTTAATEKPETNEVKPSENGTQPSEKQSQMATILVGLLIIASGLLIYNYFQRAATPEVTNQSEQQEQQANNQEQDNNDSEDSEDSDNQNESSDQDDNADSNEGQYTVTPGDSLWSIAEKVYGDGFQWSKIAEANNLDNNAYGQPTVSIGQKLNIPDSAAVAIRPSDETEGEDKKVAGVQDVQETPNTSITTYTVQHGDTLWSIAEQYYGDGHKWVEIFNSPMNELGTLDDGRPLVHTGNVLVIPSLN